VRDKDVLKNQAHADYCNNVGTLMSVPFFFQMWQIGLTGNEASVSLYRKVRFFKTASLVGAFALGAYEMHKLQGKWTYYNRFYPEATELQKGLEREALMFKETSYTEKTVAERMDATQSTASRQNYERFYSLGPQMFPEGEQDQNFNAAEHKEHN
jgi:hypothetical protein